MRVVRPPESKPDNMDVRRLPGNNNKKEKVSNNMQTVVCIAIGVNGFIVNWLFSPMRYPKKETIEMIKTGVRNTKIILWRLVFLSSINTPIKIKQVAVSGEKPVKPGCVEYKESAKL